MAKTGDLCIVIPTLNEEKYIGKLLGSIVQQTIKPKEVVVVDAFSKDKTIEVIKQYLDVLPLQYYQIPKQTISKQRNLGAKKTTAPYILFLDADVQLKDKKTLEKYLKAAEKKDPDIATSPILPLSNYWDNKLVYGSMNVIFKAAQPIWPMALGSNIWVKRSVFNKFKGFDESLRFSEDHELLQRVVKGGAKFTFFLQPRVYTSTRRLDSEGSGKYVAKMVMSLYHNLVHGYHKNPTKYEYGHFK